MERIKSNLMKRSLPEQLMISFFIAIAGFIGCGTIAGSALITMVKMMKQ